MKKKNRKSVSKCPMAIRCIAAMPTCRACKKATTVCYRCAGNPEGGCRDCG